MCHPLRHCLFLAHKRTCTEVFHAAAAREETHTAPQAFGCWIGHAQVTLNATITACQKASQWAAALHCLSQAFGDSSVQRHTYICSVMRFAFRVFLKQLTSDMLSNVQVTPRSPLKQHVSVCVCVCWCQWRIRRVAVQGRGNQSTRNLKMCELHMAQHDWYTFGVLL